MKQDRIRVCRQDGGHGELMKDDEICEEHEGYPMEERLCDCNVSTPYSTSKYICMLYSNALQVLYILVDKSQFFT